MHTINSKNIFDFFLYDFESHFNPVGVRHDMDLIGIEPVKIQDLEENTVKKMITLTEQSDLRNCNCMLTSI